MKLLIYIYYGLYILTGGLRNYYEELVLHNECLNLNVDLWTQKTIYLSEYLLTLVALVILILPFNKWLHLLFFGITFLIDFYVENFIFFEKYIIFSNLFPLFIFSFIYSSEKQYSLQTLRNIIIKIIAIGYTTAFLGKIMNGWLIFNQPVTYSWVLFFKETLNFHFHLSDLFLKIDNIFIYKAIDYLVLLFQGLGIFLFFKPRFFKWFSLFAILFHLGILLFLNLSFFYTYILIYTLILIPFTQPEKTISYDKKKHRNINLIILTLCLLYSIGLILNNFNRLYIVSMLSDTGYIYIGTLATLLCIIIFAVYWCKKFLLIII